MGEIYTFIDLETTGLDHENDQIIEIAAVKTDLEREYGRFQTFVQLDEGRDLPDFITELTGIAERELHGGTYSFFAVGALAKFFTDTTVVAHNAPFDLSFISGRAIFLEKFVCTRALAKLVAPTESASLKDVCARYGVELTGHHRAMNDVLATIEVFRKLKPIADYRGIDYRNVVVNALDRPLKYVPYGAKIVEVA
ncbi:3'-5' exonuclease [Brevibacillus laterosporus]|uniref:3'-5' exonuclease n=1 Tax=Brevibacillus laterosporus TaxID=1465 RepID=UPI00037B6FF8|nr:3'-5' exonuclease [Brevibacillus laterosporus]ATO51000.1 DNA polymerase III subunit epsilon [Brevibacillus laterosporus DSM 25]MED2004740.1 3'-5' exonuclease [Brevibacillus laterosporus]